MFFKKKSGTEKVPDKLGVRDTGQHNIIEIELSGKLGREEYDRFAPELERLIHQYGRIRLLIFIHDFHGWRLAAAWQDIKFDLQHFKNFEKIALVGENKWQEWISNIALPFATGEIRFFRRGKLNEARAWLESDQKAIKKAA